MTDDTTARRGFDRGWLNWIAGIADTDWRTVLRVVEGGPVNTSARLRAQAVLQRVPDAETWRSQGIAERLETRLRIVGEK